MATEEQQKLKDYSDESKRLIDDVKQRVAQNPTPATIQDGIYELLGMEKRTRLAVDIPSTQMLAIAILEICAQYKQWRLLIENFTILFKRRAQLQKVMEAIVSEVLKHLDLIDERSTKKQLIESIRDITAGKIFVELERARVTRILASMIEEEGKGSDESIEQAAELLGDIQVETIGSMEVREKAEILLEQYRLNLARKDYVRSEIIGRKIDVKQLNEPGMELLRDQYYALHISYHSYFNQYFEICKSYRELYYARKLSQAKQQLNQTVEESKAATSDTEMKDASAEPPKQSTSTTSSSTLPSDNNISKLTPQQLLSNIVLYGILSPWDAEISDILHRIKQEKLLNKLPAIRKVLNGYTSNELQAWPFPEENELKETLNNTIDPTQHDVDGRAGKQRLDALWKIIHTRITEHNIRVIGTYYTRIESVRLSQLLSLSSEETERILSQMVSNKQLFAQIDRTIGLVNFQRKENANDLLDALTSDIHSLLSIVDTTNHLINREFMLHQIK